MLELSMLIYEILIPLVTLFSRWFRRQSEPDVSPELREQIINIIDDLVDDIAPGYLLPNSFFPLNYRNAIYEEIYKSIWDELGLRRFENVNYRDGIFNLLRDVPSEKFFNVTEYLLKIVYRIVHIQKTIPDNIALHPHGGEKKWSRKKSVRDEHIRFFKGAVDILNYRLSQNKSEYRYKLDGNFVQMVRVDTGLDVPEENSGTQEPDDTQTLKKNSSIQETDANQKPKDHQNQSRSEFWNKRSYRITVVGVVIAILALITAILIFFFGDGILRMG